MGTERIIELILEKIQMDKCELNNFNRLIIRGERGFYPFSTMTVRDVAILSLKLNEVGLLNSFTLSANKWETKWKLKAGAISNYISKYRTDTIREILES